MWLKTLAIHQVTLLWANICISNFPTTSDWMESILPSSQNNEVKEGLSKKSSKISYFFQTFRKFSFTPVFWLEGGIDSIQSDVVGKFDIYKLAQSRMTWWIKRIARVFNHIWNPQISALNSENILHVFNIVALRVQQGKTNWLKLMQ